MAIRMREGLYKENSNEAKINILHISNALYNKVNIHRNILLQGLFGTTLTIIKKWDLVDYTISRIIFLLILGMVRFSNG